MRLGSGRAPGRRTVAFTDRAYDVPAAPSCGNMMFCKSVISPDFHTHVECVTHVVRPISLPVLVVLADVSRGRVLQRVPKLAQEGVGQLDAQLRVGGQIGNELDDAFHNHGLVVGQCLALDLGQDDRLERLPVWCVSVSMLSRILPGMCSERTGGPERLDVVPELSPSLALVKGACAGLSRQRLGPRVYHLGISFKGIGNALLVSRGRLDLERGRLGRRLGGKSLANVDGSGRAGTVDGVYGARPIELLPVLRRRHC